MLKKIRTNIERVAKGSYLSRVYPREVLREPLTHWGRLGTHGEISAGTSRRVGNVFR